MIKTGHALLLSCLLIAGCNNNNSEKLVIATSANMQFAMTALTQQFTIDTGIECETIISSSGKLTAQIREGAPYDVFISADMKYPGALFKDGYSVSQPQVYAYGILALWTMTESITPSIEQLTDNRIKHIAVANPKTAPYGVAALDVLKYYDILQNIEEKLVYGESISQTNQFIISGAAEIGFSAMSVVLSPQMKEKGNWISVDTAVYEPIAQGAVIIKNSKSQMVRSKKFYNFLFSDKGKNILNNFGYLTIQ